MTNDQMNAMIADCALRAQSALIRHSTFGIPSAFIIRASSFRRRGLFAIVLCCVAAAAGCRGTYIDVAKGKPTENENNFIPNDYTEKEPSRWEKYAPENWWKNTKKAVGLGPNEAVARQQYDAGQKLFAEKKYDAAAKEFAAAADRWPDSSLEEDAMFMRAESYFFADSYSKANDWYGELMKKYTNSRHLNTTVARQYDIARYWQQLDEKYHRWALIPNLVDRKQPMFDTGGHAVNTFNDVRVNDPHGPFAEAAIMADANIYFKRRAYEDADYYYNLVRTDYPKSKYQLDAHLLGLQCKLRKYQGPAYNGKPLEEGEQLTDQMLVQFSRELSDIGERENVIKAKAEIRAQRATRDIQLAQYFDKGKYYGSARIYYAQVLKDFPQTPFAEQAKTRLAEIERLPSTPPNRLAFITDLIEKPDPNRDAETAHEATRLAELDRRDRAGAPDTITAGRPQPSGAPGTPR
jgi:TolA-binding protein